MRTCVERAPEMAFDLDRDSWRVGSVFRHAWRTLNDRPAPTIGVFWSLLLPSMLIMVGTMLLVIPGFSSGKIDAKAYYGVKARLTTQGASIACLLLISPLLLGLFGHALGRVAGRRPGFAIVREQLARVPQYAVVLLAIIPALIALTLLQSTPDLDAVTPAKPFAAFTIRNTLLSLVGWPLMLLQYSAFFELVLDRNIDGLQALRRAATVLSYRPIGTLWTAFLTALVAFVSMSCCLVPAIFLWPFSLLAFATLYLAARTPARSA